MLTSSKHDYNANNGLNKTQKYFEFSMHTEPSLTQVTEVAGRLLSIRPQSFSGKPHFSPEKVVNDSLPQCPFSPREAFHIQRAAFACFNVVTTLFAFPAKA